MTWFIVILLIIFVAGGVSKSTNSIENLEDRVSDLEDRLDKIDGGGFEENIEE